MELSRQNNPANQPLVESLVFASKYSVDQLSASVKTLGGNPQTVRADVSAKVDSDETLQADRFSRTSLDHANYKEDLKQVYYKQALAMQVQNPSMSSGDIMDKIIAPLTDNIKLGHMNGTPYKIPAEYSEDQLDERLHKYYDENIAKLAPSGGTENGKWTRFLGAIPVLADDHSGYRFVTPIGNPIIKDKKPVTISINDLMKVKLPTATDRLLKDYQDNAFPPAYAPQFNKLDPNFTE